MTEVVGLAVLVVWWTPFFLKKTPLSQRVLCSQTLLAVGFTLQFVFPAVYFDFFPWHPQGYEDVSFYYTEMLCMALVAGIPFLAIAWFRRLSSFRPATLPPDPLTTGARVPLAILLLIGMIVVGGGVGKYLMIETGSYYHTFRTSYQFDSYDKFVIVTILAEYFVLAPLFLLAIGWKLRDRRYLFFGYAVLFVEFLFSLISGRRQFVGQLVVQYFILSLACGRVPRLVTVVTVSLLFVILLPIMETYSGYVVTEGSSSSALPKVGVMYEMYGSSTKDTSGIMAKTLFRLGDIRGAAAVCSLVPDYIEYQYGRTYLPIPFFLVPRIIWNDKPDGRDIAEFSRYALPRDPGSNPVSWVGEGYLNFSWFGVFMIGCVMAVLCNKIDDWLIPRTHYLFYGVIWAFFSYNMVWVSCTFHHLITEFLRLVIYLYLGYKGLEIVTGVSSDTPFRRPREKGATG